jgi:hypothetical protein
MKTSRQENREFTSSNIVIDDAEFENCTFTDCTLLYRGGAFSLRGNKFLGEMRFLMDGPAANTLDLLRLLYASGEYGAATVESYFAGIRGDPSSAQARFEASGLRPLG